jgi:hypothetical protein
VYRLSSGVHLNALYDDTLSKGHSHCSSQKSEMQFRSPSNLFDHDSGSINCSALSIIVKKGDPIQARKLAVLWGGLNVIRKYDLVHSILP